MSRRFATRRMIGWATGAALTAISVSGLLGGAVHADGPSGSPPVAPDAEAPDAGVLDAGVPDAGVLGAGVLDAGVVVAVGLPPVPPVPPVVPDAGVLDAGVLGAGVLDAGVVVAVGLPPVPPVAPDVEDDPSDHERRDAAVPAAVVETLSSVPSAIDELARRL